MSMERQQAVLSSMQMAMRLYGRMAELCPGFVKEEWWRNGTQHLVAAAEKQKALVQRMGAANGLARMKVVIEQGTGRIRGATVVPAENEVQA